jgi:hypothetical protein
MARRRAQSWRVAPTLHKNEEIRLEEGRFLVEKSEALASDFLFSTNQVSVKQ